MGGQVDLGLLVTARVLRCAVAVFSTCTDMELARHRRVLMRAAYGEPDSSEELADSLVEGTQGLGGLAIACGVVATIALWASRRVGYVPLSVLVSLAGGALGFAGLLAAIYGARIGWRVVRSVPRPGDFWVALSCGVVMAVGILAGRFAGVA
jgi:UDP-N-acetylmuramyl pentapeptide phosphotransferase/UDP-N-acetylglucosamine-1-phosphate transferase